MKLNFRRGGAFASQKAKDYLLNINPQDIKNVTVIRHAAIGDFVVMRPFLLEIRKFFPNAIITLSVLRSSMYGIPKDLVDNIHIMDKVDKNNKNRKTNLFQRIKQVKELPPQDFIFDLTDSTLSLLLVSFADVKIKVGYSYRSLRRMFYDISVLRSDFVLETESMFHQLNILGANTQHYPLEYKLTDKHRNTENPYIVYFAGASMKNRCWNTDKFISLIKKMILEYPNYNHIVLKGIKDDEQFNEIYKPFTENNNVLHQDALALEEIYDYLAEASLVIAGDTGIRNMAIASNVPTLGIMWAPHISALRYLPKTKEHQVVFNPDFIEPNVDEVYFMLHQMLYDLYEN